MPTDLQAEALAPPATPAPPPAKAGSRLVKTCAALADSNAFNLGIVAVILANAALLGVATYPSLAASTGGLLAGVELVFLAVFVIELAIRMIAYGRRPQDFFRDGWNVFDLVVVTAAFIPGLSANSTLLRLARIARVSRVIRFFPALRTIIIGIARSLPGMGGFLTLSVLVLYLYGMVGWLLFADHYPEDYGNVGQAVLTLFVLLSLETLPDAITAGLAVSPWTLLYYVSFVLVASYLLVNVLIGVVISSMEESRAMALRERLDDARDQPRPPGIDRLAVAQRLEELRANMRALEAELDVAHPEAHHDAHRESASGPPQQRGLQS